MGITTGEILLIESGQSTGHSNAGGYGLWCNKACAARKDAERAAKEQAQAQQLAIQQQALAGLTSGAGEWSTGKILGVTLGSLAGVGLLLFAIKKMKK